MTQKQILELSGLPWLSDVQAILLKGKGDAEERKPRSKLLKIFSVQEDSMARGVQQKCLLCFGLQYKAIFSPRNTQAKQNKQTKKHQKRFSSELKCQ